MTLAIHDQGGLTESEIKLAIEESAERRETALDTKLSSHRDQMNKRMDRVEDGLQNNQDRLADVQAKVAVISQDNGRQTELLEKIVTQGEQWHVDDLKFREDIIVRVTKIEKDQGSLTTEVKRLRLVGWVFLGLGKSTRFCYQKLCEIGIWKVAFVAILLWALHLISPALYQLAVKLVNK